VRFGRVAGNLDREYLLVQEQQRAESLILY
jgi:hypothetical protein